MLLQLLKTQQLVPVVFILLFPGLDLGGEAAGQVVAEGVKAVKDGDDATLFFNGRDSNFGFADVVII